VLVDGEYNVLQIRGDVDPYLTHGQGDASFAVLTMAREGLLVPLQVLLQRAKQSNAPARDTSVPPSPEDRAFRREAVRRLYAELDRLEPRQRLAFTLFAIDGRSLREIAAIMDSTLTTAKLRTWRARRALAKRAQKDPLLSEYLSDQSGQEEELTP
jgi:RNA polymerase sigma factor (sigma-70 family)